MPQYVPILKSKAAEYWAWQTAGWAVVSGSRPVFEIVPKRTLDEDLARFVNEIAKGWHRGALLTLDTSYLDQMQTVAGTTHRAIHWTALELLGRGVSIKPVMRLDDDFAVLAEVAASAAMHREGACLRLGTPDGDPDANAAASQWPTVHQQTGLAPSEVDLLIDLGVVRDPRDIARAAAIVMQVLHWAQQNGPWRSIAVASGAFPSSFSSDFGYGQPTTLRRYDADLYARVSAENPSIPLDFGDYGIWYPGSPSDAPFRPNPNLRYTYQREWKVYREQRILPGNESFYTICGRVIGSAHWPVAGAAYSVGDAEIARRAQHTGGPGTATHWLRWAASHHFAHVVDRLASLGVP